MPSLREAEHSEPARLARRPLCRLWRQSVRVTLRNEDLALTCGSPAVVASAQFAHLPAVLRTEHAQVA